MASNPANTRWRDSNAAHAASAIRGASVPTSHRRVVSIEPRAVDVLGQKWVHALAWNYSLERLAKKAGVDRAEFDRASHDAAWGRASSRVWRA